MAGDLVDVVGRAVGPAGMVGGQQEDLDAEGLEVDARRIRRIHLGKTARMLSAALEAGALLGGVSGDRRAGLAGAGLDLGLAFQGTDDILDVTASSAELGKSPGKDADAGKATWVAVEGLEAARKRSSRYGRAGLKGLERNLPAGTARKRLLALGAMMWNRDR